MAEELSETPKDVDEAVADAGEQPIKQRKNGLYPALSDELAENMTQGWADTELHDLQPIEQAAETAGRRAALSARFPGERLVVPAGNLKTRSNDTEYAFRSSVEYAYLTGDQTEDGVLVLEPTEAGHEATIYLLPRSNRENGEFWLDGQGELWVGRRHSLTEAEQLLGLPAKDVRELAGALAEATGPVRVVRGYDAGIEAALTDKVTAERDEELKVFLSEARLVKDAFEVRELQKAVDSTVRGFEDVVRVLDKAEATSERYIEGTFFLRARVEGNDIGYGSICAAGPHATTLHWVRNNGQVRSGDLLLLDAGVETHTLYTADVTRTLPINGTYSPLQRKIYDAVYEAQEAGIAAVRPGAKYRDFHEASQRVLATRLVEWGILEGPVDRVLELGLQRRFTLHGTGHMLGMDVHDCAVARTETYVQGTLEPGMCLTVEPGLYFQADDLTVPEEYRGIGVRIEDDILVTEDGNRNLSAALPRTSDEVERWMAELKG
ncbi:aminopeptidase P family protein [Streptomyces albidoflavus]|uniref:Aminopeptidase P family protein n=2 Tax=Streptomyces TaxID=1883 RepID=A0ACC7Y5I7_9ACTN|nr:MULTISPECIES: aminopeptidase P family protein [Streptomyces]MYQ71273.1 M24 family metallopeptidase [Streptomyces sp. SID4934]MYW58535.1 M24 family metallopeptidase [Streptomyces sp. SID8370]MYW88865.1 M24 family metallopeptidase [Streptomyces sp. SID8371]MYX87454.1 M24 family metallopeptidase [Streptomyces sp. SID4915]NUW08224.1 aminopeptidase P family protein [Streptomyces sp. CAI-21]NVI29114.1 aminopeptidase P family protein [Streptomyces sp. CAI-17]SCD50207.1 Xaa-Pro aminopeptidase [St